MGVLACIKHRIGLTNYPLMSNNKSPNSFEILQTLDGSPTLSLAGGEKMHSMEGAFSESLYIYGESLSELFTLSPKPRILSMGLGLSYNEWIALAMIFSEEREDFQIHSFESQGFLNQNLLCFLKGEAPPLSSCYQDIVERTAKHFNQSETQLFEFAKKAIDNQFWVLHDSLSVKNSTGTHFNCVFYDAFSSATDEDLWSETHLNQFIDEYCQDSPCLFSTYAATGNLKRALGDKGFELERKKGFGKKRQSTLARRFA